MLLESTQRPGHPVVDLWTIDDAMARRLAATRLEILSPDERERALHYRNPLHAERFIARRAMLRIRTGEYLNCDPATVIFDVNEAGKPFLQSAGLSFSTAQTSGMALLAFAWNCQIGIDVERVTEMIDALAVGREVFSDAEMRALAKEPGSFFRLWTRKEALLKALGFGLTRDPKSVNTMAAPEGWTLRDLAPAPFICGALAVSVPDVSIMLRSDAC